jgi:hypothetical protein
LIVELSQETLIDVEAEKIKNFLREIETAKALNVAGHRKSKSGFKSYSDLVNTIMFEVLKLICMEVISLIIESSVINTNPFLVKSMLQNYSRISKDWNNVCMKYMLKSNTYTFNLNPTLIFSTLEKNL